MNGARPPIGYRVARVARYVELTDLAIGDARVSLRLERVHGGKPELSVLANKSGATIEVLESG